MQKLFYLIIFFAVTGVGCRTAKKAQRSVKADTVITQSPAKTLKPVDSTTIWKQQVADVLNAPANFTTFYGKAKASFSSSQASGNVTVYIKMQKDSIIWISVTGPLNIEGARILVTPDSIKIINKLEGSVQLSSIAQLQKLTKLPLTFSDFQNVILGKPIVDKNIESEYKFSKDSVTITATGELLKYIYSFSKNNFQLGQSNFQTIKNTSAMVANIFYNDYQQTDNISFPASRDIAVTGSAAAHLELSFKEFNFNQPQSFVFTISKNYTIKYE